MSDSLIFIKSHEIILTIISSILLLSCGYSISIIYAEILINDQNLKIELVATGLNFPTGMAFLGPDDILVSEKSGKVQRIVGNQTHVGQTVLDISTIVDSRRERGLLGLALAHDEKDKSGNDISENTKYKNDSIIYLYYTDKLINSIVGGPCVPNPCNVDYAVNNLVEYGFKNGHLLKRAHLLTIPFDKDNPAFEHVGGVISLGPDNNIYIITGDGHACHSYEDCKTSVNGGPLDSSTANSINGSAPIGAGGILFVPLDGNLAHDDGILGDQYPLNLYYAYGIRNSFGIDFDPVTGNLWDTENGPYYGDEINLVEPGFNSGWTKVQGLWPIRNYTELVKDGPEGTRGHPPDSYHLENENETLVDFNGNGKYSQPEFTWNQSVGVTSIKFFNSDKLGEKYKNDMFVAAHNDDGWIFHFDLDGERKNLKLKGQLKDRVADSQDELYDVFFARGFGSITDLEVGPDGYLYVLSIGKGAIFKVIPR